MIVKEIKTEKGYIEEQKCSACGHVHKTYYYEEENPEITEEFIRLGLTSSNSLYYGNEVRMYACPICGTVQIGIDR